jgi:hypothetical protein
VLAVAVAFSLIPAQAASVTSSNPPPPSPPPGGGGNAQPQFPIRAAFYYPWYPEAWNQKDIFPYTHFNPSLGFYSSGDPAVIDKDIRALEYGKIDAGISSWWGLGSKTDARFPQLLHETDTLGSAIRWAPYYEGEGYGNPDPSQIESDLAYIKSHYTSDRAYLRVDGKPVIFVYADANDDCGMADRWQRANASEGFFVVLKVFAGYRACASQPDGWHQYGPASARDRQPGDSFSISPGFDKADEPAPRLTRDLASWDQDIRAMVASNEPWQLITTFNEWGEGTAVESATQWDSSSGYGQYLDALHGDGQGSTLPPGPPPPPSPTPTPSPTPSPVVGPCGTKSTPPATYKHVIWIWMENHRYTDVIGSLSAPYTTSLALQCGAAIHYSIVGSPSLPNYVGATFGDTFGISDDAEPSAHNLTSDNLFRQVRSSGGTVKSYQEDMPSNCALTSSGRYAVKHNPEAYANGAGDRAACQADNVPMGATTSGNLLDDLKGNSLPTFSFITPNLCNDTHDCSVATGDNWLKSWVPKILASHAYQSGDTALVIMYDEYTPMPNVFITPSTTPGTLATANFDHYSLLRTTEEMLGIKNFLLNAASAASMRPAFNM